MPEGLGIPNFPCTQGGSGGLIASGWFPPPTTTCCSIAQTTHHLPASAPPGRPARAHPPHSRECSSSRAALAARSRPVGSKLLHLSLGPGRSPVPRSPLPSPPGCTGGRGRGGPVPSPLEPLMPKSHDMVHKRRRRGDLQPNGLAGLTAGSTRREPAAKTAQAQQWPFLPGNGCV